MAGRCPQIDHIARHCSCFTCIPTHGQVTVFSAQTLYITIRTNTTFFPTLAGNPRRVLPRTRPAIQFSKQYGNTVAYAYWPCYAFIKSPGEFVHFFPGRNVMDEKWVSRGCCNNQMIWHISNRRGTLDCTFIINMTLKCGKCLNVVNSLSLGSILSIDTGLDGVDAADIGGDRNTSLYMYTDIQALMKQIEAQV